ncbi:replication-associated recombination protein A [Pseudoclavibacter soli]|uniref:replication-associated recombination protein A n=1 Tax=Pseudoclavibacter soli TaxID=452623 RepID=UPI000420604F|nr:replication-associated recombination protein A [Pseudoclavibacter soli]
MTSLGSARSLRPLAARMRPTTLEEVVGQAELRRTGSPLWNLCHPGEGGRMPASVVLFGPPGTGKTTLAHVIAHQGGRRFVELSAISAGVKDVRRVMEQAQGDRDLYGTQTVLFLDEIHRFTKAQQDSLLPGVEDGVVTLVAATTENPSFSVISPLLSRSLVLRLHSLDDADLAELLDRAVTDQRGLDGSVTLSDQARSDIVALADGDARRALTLLEASAGQATINAGGAAEGHPADESPDAQPPEITAETVAAVADRALVRYDQNGDQHYDVVSAFIKSIRGSDVDAAVHYLARMIEGGEDPRFIARRLIISASEDIGTADPQALPIAVAAAQAVALIGLPEGRIPLAEATVYLAAAPKSNAAYLAVDRAIADIRAGNIGQVPAHLRDAHYQGAKRLGHGVGYKYPHDDPNGVSAQQYLPDELAGRRYYEPGAHGFDAAIAKRLARVRELLDGHRG